MEQPAENRASAKSNEVNLTRPQMPMDPVFIGPAGLRAGWRLAVYLAAFYFLTYATFFLASPLFSAIPEGRMHDPYVILIGDCIQFVAALLPAFAMARLEKRSFSTYGLPPTKAFGKNFWIGAAWGISALTALLAIMRAFGIVYFGTVSVHGLRMLKFAAFWGSLFLVVAFYEEFFTRGYTQFTLTDGIGFWPAAVALSAIFGASHLLNPGENWHGALGAGLIGFFWCFTLRRTGTLWFAIGMHAAWDWSETFLYAVPDSGIIAPGHLLKSSFQGSRWLTGGSVGPEGSVLLFLVIAALWALFDRIYPAAKYNPASQNN